MKQFLLGAVAPDYSWWLVPAMTTDPSQHPNEPSHFVNRNTNAISSGAMKNPFRLLPQGPLALVPTVLCTMAWVRV